MEIAILVFFGLVAALIGLVENTRGGRKFADWCFKNLVGIDINKLGE